jgi:predicted MPP superfamily phosphohydrolase
MMHDIADLNQHYLTRMQKQSEKPAVTSEEPACYPLEQTGMRAVAAVIENILKYSGLHGIARQNCIDYRLEVNHVFLPRLPTAFEGYTILHLSDLHTDGLADDGEGIVRIIENIHCDLAVMTGDFSFEETGVYCSTCLKALTPIIESISALDGIYGVLGNHDTLEMVPELEKLGVQMLLNDAAWLRRGSTDIVLSGVDDPHYYKCHDLKKALTGATPDKFQILLSHSPEIAPEASGYGIDFCLCGHTHGGQICLPGGIALYANSPCNRRYISGSWKCGDMKGYTSRGTGFSCATARFFCPPEITLHILHSGGTVSESREDYKNDSRGKFSSIAYDLFCSIF